MEGLSVAIDVVLHFLLPKYSQDQFFWMIYYFNIQIGSQFWIKSKPTQA